MITKGQGFHRNKYKDHSHTFNAYLLINNYERTNPLTENYVKTCLVNYILYMKPDIWFKDEHTNRNFYHLIIRDKGLWENTKVQLTSAWIKVYDTIEYFFTRDIYDYTAFHYWLIMGHYKMALQILMYCSATDDFELPYYINMEGYHEFHDHPLTFFIWKNTDEGVKEGSKREKVLRLLLEHSDNDVLLVKNKVGFSAFEYLLQKDHIKMNSGKKKHRSHMIKIIWAHKLRWKYLHFVMHAQPLKKLKVGLKLLIAKNLT